jgi:hypothetical protein
LLMISVGGKFADGFVEVAHDQYFSAHAA